MTPSAAMRHACADRPWSPVPQILLRMRSVFFLGGTTVANHTERANKARRQAPAPLPPLPSSHSLPFQVFPLFSFNKARRSKRNRRRKDSGLW